MLLAVEHEILPIVFSLFRLEIPAIELLHQLQDQLIADIRVAFFIVRINDHFFNASAIDRDLKRIASTLTHRFFILAQLAEFSKSLVSGCDPGVKSQFVAGNRGMRRDETGQIISCSYLRFEQIPRLAISVNTSR